MPYPQHFLPSLLEILAGSPIAAGASWGFGVGLFLFGGIWCPPLPARQEGQEAVSWCWQLGFLPFLPLLQPQQERAEWENLNKLLTRRGLKPVSLAAPQSCGNISGKEMTILQVFVFLHSNPKFMRHL